MVGSKGSKPDSNIACKPGEGRWWVCRAQASFAWRDSWHAKAGGETRRLVKPKPSPAGKPENNSSTAGLEPCITNYSEIGQKKAARRPPVLYKK